MDLKNIQWKCHSFDELTSIQIYNILKLRSEVFVVEQQCIFLDMDDKDQESFHITGYIDDQLIAYTRILPPGLAYAETSIGRVVTAPFMRKSGAGKILMEHSIQQAWKIFGKKNIRIGAQYYLLNFYQSLGFNAEGNIYIEDGIEHIEMLLHS